MNNNFILIWPDGTHDSPNGLGSWNVSKSIGPEGPICDLNREEWDSPTECHYSCPLCDEWTSCDWQSCYDDVGFIRFVIQTVKDQWCIDENQMHMTGYSNGGMFSYSVATSVPDNLGLASIVPVSASPHVGFGNPPASMSLSVLDMHGFFDDIIPYDRESPYCYGLSETGGVISPGGDYFEEKPTLVKEWSAIMNCQDEEAYPTPFDGEGGFQCFERKCSLNRSFVRCIGNQGHWYPLSSSSAAEVAWEFMKNNPKQ